MNTALEQTNDMERAEFVRAGEFATRKVAGQTVVVPVRGVVGDLSAVFTLNESGSLIWSMLESPRSPSELVTALTEEFDVPVEEACADVRDYLDRLQTAGLIRPSRVPEGA